VALMDFQTRPEGPKGSQIGLLPGRGLWVMRKRADSGREIPDEIDLVVRKQRPGQGNEVEPFISGPFDRIVDVEAIDVDDRSRSRWVSADNRLTLAHPRSCGPLPERRPGVLPRPHDPDDPPSEQRQSAEGNHQPRLVPGSRPRSQIRWPPAQCRSCRRWPGWSPAYDVARDRSMNADPNRVHAPCHGPRAARRRGEAQRLVWSPSSLPRRNHDAPCTFRAQAGCGGAAGTADQDQNLAPQHGFEP